MMLAGVVTHGLLASTHSDHQEPVQVVMSESL